jgi:hypothetical protein
VALGQDWRTFLKALAQIVYKFGDFFSRADGNFEEWNLP